MMAGRGVLVANLQHSQPENFKESCHIAAASNSNAWGVPRILTKPREVDESEVHNGSLGGLSSCTAEEGSALTRTHHQINAIHTVKSNPHAPSSQPHTHHETAIKSVAALSVVLKGLKSQAAQECHGSVECDDVDEVGVKDKLVCDALHEVEAEDKLVSHHLHQFDPEDKLILKKIPKDKAIASTSLEIFLRQDEDKLGDENSSFRDESIKLAIPKGLPNDTAEKMVQEEGKIFPQFAAPNSSGEKMLNGVDFVGRGGKSSDNILPLVFPVHSAAYTKEIKCRDSLVFPGSEIGCVCADTAAVDTNILSVFTGDAPGLMQRLKLLKDHNEEFASSHTKNSNPPIAATREDFHDNSVALSSSYNGLFCGKSCEDTKSEWSKSSTCFPIVSSSSEVIKPGSTSTFLSSNDSGYVFSCANSSGVAQAAEFRSFPSDIVSSAHSSSPRRSSDVCSTFMVKFPAAYKESECLLSASSMQGNKLLMDGQNHQKVMNEGNFVESLPRSLLHQPLSSSQGKISSNSGNSDLKSSSSSPGFNWRSFHSKSVAINSGIAPTNEEIGHLRTHTTENFPAVFDNNGGNESLIAGGIASAFVGVCDSFEKPPQSFLRSNHRDDVNAAAFNASSCEFWQRSSTHHTLLMQSVTSPSHSSASKGCAVAVPLPVDSGWATSLAHSSSAFLPSPSSQAVCLYSHSSSSSSRASSPSATYIAPPKSSPNHWPPHSATSFFQSTESSWYRSCEDAAYIHTRTPNHGISEVESFVDLATPIARYYPAATLHSSGDSSAFFCPPSSSNGKPLSVKHRHEDAFSSNNMKEGDDFLIPLSSANKAENLQSQRATSLQPPLCSFKEKTSAFSGFPTFGELSDRGPPQTRREMLKQLCMLDPKTGGIELCVACEDFAHPHLFSPRRFYEGNLKRESLPSLTHREESLKQHSFSLLAHRDEGLKQDSLSLLNCRDISHVLFNRLKRRLLSILDGLARIGDSHRLEGDEEGYLFHFSEILSSKENSVSWCYCSPMASLPEVFSDLPVDNCNGFYRRCVIPPPSLNRKMSPLIDEGVVGVSDAASFLHCREMMQMSRFDHPGFSSSSGLAGSERGVFSHPARMEIDFENPLPSAHTATSGNLGVPGEGRSAGNASCLVSLGGCYMSNSSSGMGEPASSSFSASSSCISSTLSVGPLIASSPLCGCDVATVGGPNLGSCSAYSSCSSTLISSASSLHCESPIKPSNYSFSRQLVSQTDSSQAMTRGNTEKTTGGGNIPNNAGSGYAENATGGGYKGNTIWRVNIENTTGGLNTHNTTGGLNTQNTNGFNSRFPSDDTSSGDVKANTPDNIGDFTQKMGFPGGSFLRHPPHLQWQQHSRLDLLHSHPALKNSQLLPLELEMCLPSTLMNYVFIMEPALLYAEDISTLPASTLCLMKEKLRLLRLGIMHEISLKEPSRASKPKEELVLSSSTSSVAPIHTNSPTAPVLKTDSSFAGRSSSPLIPSSDCNSPPSHRDATLQTAGAPHPSATRQHTAEGNEIPPQQAQPQVVCAQSIGNILAKKSIQRVLRDCLAPLLGEDAMEGSFPTEHTKYIEKYLKDDPSGEDGFAAINLGPSQPSLNANTSQSSINPRSLSLSAANSGDVERELTNAHIGGQQASFLGRSNCDTHAFTSNEIEFVKLICSLVRDILHKELNHLVAVNDADGEEGGSGFREDIGGYGGKSPTGFPFASSFHPFDGLEKENGNEIVCMDAFHAGDAVSLARSNCECWYSTQSSCPVGYTSESVVLREESRLDKDIENSQRIASRVEKLVGCATRAEKLNLVGSHLKSVSTATTSGEDLLHSRSKYNCFEDGGVSMEKEKVGVLLGGGSNNSLAKSSTREKAVASPSCLKNPPQGEGGNDDFCAKSDIAASDGGADVCLSSLSVEQQGNTMNGMRNAADMCREMNFSAEEGVRGMGGLGRSYGFRTKKLVKEDAGNEVDTLRQMILGGTSSEEAAEGDVFSEFSDFSCASARGAAVVTYPSFLGCWQEDGSSISRSSSNAAAVEEADGLLKDASLLKTYTSPEDSVFSHNRRKRLNGTFLCASSLSNSLSIASTYGSSSGSLRPLKKQTLLSEVLDCVPEVIDTLNSAGSGVCEDVGVDYAPSHEQPCTKEAEDPSAEISCAANVSTSPVSSIHKLLYGNLPLGVFYQNSKKAYCANWYDNGKQEKRYFSINKLGIQQAKEQAIAARKNYEQRCRKGISHSAPNKRSSEKKDAATEEKCNFPEPCNEDSKSPYLCSGIDDTSIRISEGLMVTQKR